MNPEDPSTSEIKPRSSQVNDNSQFVLESRVVMLGETLVVEIEEFQKMDRKSEMTSDPKSP